ncbi:UNVERIFIED_CONTAM: hypothetical protein FKN15_069498 [Acipenser sinensis]
MEEFDRECPMIKTFCQQLSEDEFEEQALSYTERALLDLFRTMDQNPELYERVIRKRKQGELEKASVGSCLKAKFFTAVEGQMNRCNAVGAAELRQRVGHLKEEMKKVQAYAQGTAASSVDLTALSESEPESSSNPHHNIQYELLASIPLKRLRATGIVRSPGGTPLNTPRKSGEESSPASAFNTALITKFRNALSPPGTSSLDSPERSDSDADSSGFATPHGTP